MESVTAIVPVLNETTALEKTVHILLEENPKEIQEILIVVSPVMTTKESRTVANRLVSRYAPVIRIIEQHRPFLGGALQDGFDAVHTPYAVMMAADLETDPHTVRHLIE